MENQLEPSSTSLPTEVIEKVITELKTKAQENHRIAKTYFYMIIGVVSLGLWIFVFAYRITSSSEVENVLTASKANLERELRTTQQLMDSVREDMERFTIKEKFYNYLGLTFVIFRNDENEKFKDSVAMAKDAATKYSIIRMQYDATFRLLYDFRGIDSAIRKPDILDTTTLFKTLDSHRKDLYSSFRGRNLSIDSISSRYFQRVKAEVLGTLRTSNYELYSLINTTAIRIGSVVIVLFLIQILVRVFRYNTRLGNFYAARAQALEIYSKDQKNQSFKDLVASLSPDNLDMGMSKNPSEQLIELAKLFSKN